MSFKDLYKPKVEYCGIDLASLDKKRPKIKVCGGYDFYSSFSYKVLIEKNKHLPFMNKVKEEYPFLGDKDLGSLIRWLYRGMTLEQAINKVVFDFNRIMNFVERAEIRKVNGKSRIKVKY